MDCWHRYDQSFVPQPRNPRPVQMRPSANFSMANSAATSTTLVDPSWYPDSGASHHMTPDSTNLQDSSDYTGSELVLVGNGSGLCINQIGSSTFQSSSNSQSFKLNNLLNDPQITKNILSVLNLLKTILSSLNSILIAILCNLRLPRRHFSKAELKMAYTSLTH